ncbi:uncharacterized protein [Primulina eburnea]|uniref:uncharacterized protein n=1 Tax=Primulina eburnea TaxID=1245227 RepID=UPI003C6C3BA5
MKSNLSILLSVVLFLSITTSYGFQSDELPVDDEKFGLEGGRSPDPVGSTRPVSPTPSARMRSLDSSSDPDSKVQFTLEHAFGESEFSPAGSFSGRLKTWSHGGVTLTKLRFSRNIFTETHKVDFKRLLEEDDFYRIRLPSNLLNTLGRDYVFSSVKARCLIRDTLDEHFVIHMEGVNILAVNYGSPGFCQYPRLLRLPSKWSFKSHTVLKSSDMAPRTPIFTEAGAVGEDGQGEEMKPERSFWAKYWIYLIPLGLVAMNAMTQAMNMPEEQANGQPASQQAIAGRGQAAAVRRR